MLLTGGLELELALSHDLTPCTTTRDLLSSFLISVDTPGFSDTQPFGDQGKKRSWELPGPQAIFKERSAARCG